MKVYYSRNQGPSKIQVISSFSAVVFSTVLCPDS